MRRGETIRSVALGLALSAGLIIFTDMRLVGVWFRHVPVPDILQQHVPALRDDVLLLLGEGTRPQ